MSDNAVFLAAIPPIMSAIRIGGGMAEVLRILYRRDQVLEVPLRTAKLHG